MVFFLSLSLTVQQQPNLIEVTNFKTTSGTINLAERIGVKYKSLGIQLLEDATGSITDAIEKECHFLTVDIILKIFKRWVEGRGRKPITWATLIEVLKNIQLSTLAHDIEQSL